MMIQELSLAVRVKCFSGKPFGRNILATVDGEKTFVCENVNLKNSDGNVRIFCGLWVWWMFVPRSIILTAFHSHPAVRWAL